MWWTQKTPREEKIWISIAIVWAIIMFGMMPLWHVVGEQNPSTVTYKTTPAQFQRDTDEFIAKYKVGEDSGIAVVEPPANSDIYLLAKQWSWQPVLKLKKGATYRLHLSSIDVQHGFSLYPLSINFMVIPEYEYVLTITPTQAGEYHVVCNEFCGIGHHLMVGKIIVE
jgi:cytochrome c oxidase subunit 2